jgi:hypothetical protein
MNTYNWYPKVKNFEIIKGFYLTRIRNTYVDPSLNFTSYIVSPYEIDSTNIRNQHLLNAKTYNKAIGFINLMSKYNLTSTKQSII